MVKPETSRYMLVDGNALVHRGYHALPGLVTKEGRPTGAVYGFLLILLKAMSDLKPTHAAVAFDLAGPTFRHREYAAYKATRVKADQELYDQIPLVKQAVRAINIPLFEKLGYEADDILGTLARQVCQSEKNSRCEVYVVTGDLDTLQLVNDRVKIYTMRKGLSDTQVYDQRAVRDRYGLNPDQMVDFRALKGDPSDNIPGVKGIGEKTAAALISRFGTIDLLYRELKQKSAADFGVSPRIRELLRDQEEGARLSYRLSQIDCEVPLNALLPRYRFDRQNFNQTFQLFQELEFKSLLAKLPKIFGDDQGGSNPQNVSGVELSTAADRDLPRKYSMVLREEELTDALSALDGAQDLVVDVETTSTSAADADLVGIGLSASPGTAFYIPAATALRSEGLRRLLGDEKIKKVGHNIKYDLEVLERAGMPLGGVWFDTMVASYLLNPGTRQHGLDALVFSELGFQMQPIEQLIGKGKKQITMDQVPQEQVSDYCCQDADMTKRLQGVFTPRLAQDKLERVFFDIEMPLVSVLARMERQGIGLDTGFLNRLAGEAEVEIKRLETDIHGLTGQAFNLNSPKQLKEVLFEKLRLVPVENRKTKTGLSTAAGELEKMIGQHPVIPKLLEYRELSKLHSTYLLALPLLVSKKTGRLHTSFNQTVAATGRLSSSDPNLQNIPVRGTGLGNRIRQAFLAKEGFELLSLDYSQIELRIVAHLAKDPLMSKVFQDKEDIHTNTAREIFGVPAAEVTPDMRRDAKTINFGILYGLSSFGLSSRIGEVSRGEAKHFIEKYFRAYPRVERYIEDIKLQVNQEGFVRNELGRIRRFPDIRARNWQLRAAAERAAVNFPIQSLAADVIKVAMINIDKEIQESKTEIRMLLQVHDELVFEVRSGQARRWAERLSPLMEQAIKLSVPLRVEGKAGRNWGEMQKLNLAA